MNLQLPIMAERERQDTEVSLLNDVQTYWG